MGETDFEDGIRGDPGPAVCDGARLRALELTGLGASQDAEMERYAEWVRRDLGVPTALVSLVQADRQVFPGMVGLAGPFADARSTPLTHSFCQHVVASAEPLVVVDARTDALVRDNLAVPDLSVVAYAGFPLTDEQGRVLGSLCAIDREPRAWSPGELATLRDIARSCSSELRRRLGGHDAVVEERRRDRIEHGQRVAFDRSRMLLAASQAFADTSTVLDVRRCVADLLAGDLRPTLAETVLRDRHGRLHRLPLGADTATDSGDVDDTRPTSSTFPLEELMPSVTAIRRNRLVHYDDRDEIAAHHPPEVVEVIADLGIQTVVAVPVPGATGSAVPNGSIVLGWDRPNAVEADDLLVIATMAGYAGQAIERARLLQYRTTVAHEMQDAMLSVLPEVDGLSMAARYAPADAQENVGGDWYDAVRLGHPQRSAPDVLALSVGDILGHDLPAITVMGQARSMLRQAAWDNPGGPPSEILASFEAANRGLGIGAAGTAIVIHLCREPGQPWVMRWSNAGHPPPVLLLPDGTIEILHEHGPLFGFDFSSSTPRRDEERTVEPGATLFLYTDGLVERRGSDIDAGTDRLVAALDAARHGTAADVVDAAMSTLPRGSGDDTVAFAVRFTDTGV